MAALSHPWLCRLGGVARGVTCASVLTATIVAQAAPVDVEAELRRVRSDVDGGKVAAAKARFERLLGAEANRDWLLVRREKVLDEARRIAFFTDYVPPAPRELIAGELREWVPRSGRIALGYRGDQVADFVATDDGAWLHPLAFTGDHAIEVKGVRYPDAEGGVRLFVGVTAAGAYSIVCGGSSSSGQVPIQVNRVTPAAAQNLGTAASPLRAGEPWSIGVRVTAGTIAVTVGGRPVLRVAKSAADWGQVALARTDFTELAIEGQVTSAWLDGRRDRHLQAALATFAATFDPRGSVPAWLLEAPRHAQTRELAYPCAVSQAEADRLDAAMRLVDEERYHDALADAAEQLAAGGTEPAWVFVRAMAFAGQRHWPSAIACLDEVLRQYPGFARAGRLRAQLRWRTGHRVAAIAELRALIELVPQDPVAAADLVAMQLRCGRADLAARDLAAARARGAHSEALDRVAATLAKAERGPDWSRRFEYRSTHYEVASDIDAKTCVEVANVLEEALATFAAELGPIDLEGRALRVFVFGGESGYRAYYEDVLGTVRLHTTGLYSSMLKQLLVWQTGDRERMLQTARHEGLHQYLDFAMRDAPIWFNEGLAGYYETESARGGRRGAQATRAIRLRALHQQGLLPLRVLLASTEAEFHADAARAYAQSWALVRALREGSAADKQRFRELLARLREGQLPADVVAAVLPPPVLDELDRTLQRWLVAQSAAPEPGR